MEEAVHCEGRETRESASFNANSEIFNEIEFLGVRKYSLQTLIFQCSARYEKYLTPNFSIFMKNSE